MAGTEVFGVMKKYDGPTIKSLMTWEETEVLPRKAREKCSNLLTETQEAYSYVKFPQRATQNLPVANSEIPQVDPIEIKSDISGIPLKKEKKEKKDQEISRNLPNSTFSKKYEKPIFACYGQGNISNKSKRLFSKGTMKTFNVLPFTKEAKGENVHQTAKMKSILNKSKPLKFSKKIPEETLFNAEFQTEIPSEIPENSNNFIEKLTQIEAIPITANCLNCKNPLTTTDLTRDPIPSSRQTFIPTSKVPSAGKDFTKSDSSYKVIFNLS